MPLLSLEDLSYPAVAALDRARTVLLLSVSPLEEHGPHLPLNVDLLAAEHFAGALAERFLADHEDWNVVRMPPLPVGCGGFDAPGTVEVRASTVRNLVYDFGASFARHGFRYLFICNGHGAVTQLVELEDAARSVERKYGMKMVSLSSSIIPEILGGAYWERIERFLGRPLSQEERSQLAVDTHAGLLETSVMLELRPEQVGEYQHLQPYTPSRFTRFIPNHAMRIGGSGYVGYPAQATRELGSAAVKAFVEVAYAKMLEAMDNPARERRSALAKVPVLRAGFRQRTGLVMALAAAVAFGYFIARRRQDSYPDT